MSRVVALPRAMKPMWRRCRQRIIDCDSLLRVMDARYNDLCERRKEAFAECDAVRRAELIAESDRACGEFADSLEWLLQLRAMQ